MKEQKKVGANNEIHKKFQEFIVNLIARDKKLTKIHEEFERTGRTSVEDQGEALAYAFAKVDFSKDAKKRFLKEVKADPKMFYAIEYAAFFDFAFLADAMLVGVKSTEKIARKEAREAGLDKEATDSQVDAEIAKFEEYAISFVNGMWKKRAQESAGEENTPEYQEKIHDEFVTSKIRITQRNEKL